MPTTDTAPQPDLDCAIIGGGAAGLSAALVLGRARRHVLVLDQGEPSNLPAHRIGGLLGSHDTSPADLYAIGHRQLAELPSVNVRPATVHRLEVGGGLATLTLADGQAIRARRALLAMGMRYAAPPLPGIAPLWGRSVFHCPFCHGWEVRDGRLAVLAGPHLVHRSALLATWSDDVVVMLNGQPHPEGEEGANLRRLGLTVDPRPIAELVSSDGTLAAARMDDGTERPLDGMLVAAPLAQRSDLVAQLGVATNATGAVVSDMLGRTDIAEVFAAGDVAGAMSQVAAAMASGSAAGAGVHHDLICADTGLPPLG